MHAPTKEQQIKTHFRGVLLENEQKAKAHRTHLSSPEHHARLVAIDSALSDMQYDAQACLDLMAAKTDRLGLGTRTQATVENGWLTASHQKRG
jgi:hypothetical protein